MFEKIKVSIQLMNYLEYYGILIISFADLPFIVID